MANAEQLEILKQGVEAWNKWRGEHLGIKVDLGGANLSKMILTGAHLTGANFTGSNLRRANLIKAKFFRAQLNGANLKGANLKGADLRAANLEGANLRGVNLKGADLRKAQLSNADLSWADLIASNFSYAEVGSTIFAASDLSMVIGLEDVMHNAPSSVSTDIFARSRAKIPEVFLRGCGLSDWELEIVKLYDPDMNSDEFMNVQKRIFDLHKRQALQVSSLFISYSHADGEFVDKVGDYLTNKGIRYWRDIHDAKAGRIEKQIDLAIRQNPTVLLILSSNSIKSDWVEHEVKESRKLEKELGRDVLCPVALDDCWKDSKWPKRIMEQIMEYNILDFSDWKDDRKFDDMFRRLIDGLELFYKG